MLIPGGSFWMGAQSADTAAPNYDGQARGDEQPVHEATLSPFFLSKYEMTQGQWERFVGSNPSLHDQDQLGKGSPLISRFALATAGARSQKSRDRMEMAAFAAASIIMKSLFLWGCNENKFLVSAPNKMIRNGPQPGAGKMILSNSR